MALSNTLYLQWAPPTFPLRLAHIAVSYHCPSSNSRGSYKPPEVQFRPVTPCDPIYAPVHAINSTQPRPTLLCRTDQQRLQQLIMLFTPVPFTTQTQSQLPFSLDFITI